MARISLSSLPSQHATKVIDFPKLNGGLNLWELDYNRLDNSQSPDMKNLWWADGILQSRDGQVYAIEPGDVGVGYACTQELFWDHAFFHIGTKLFWADPGAEPMHYTELTDGVPQVRGTFFRYGDHLYYKTKGAFIQITYNPTAPHFTAKSLADGAYVPTILLNAEAATGSGDTYQPENRLSAKKKVCYNAAETIHTQSYTGDGSTTTFAVGAGSSAQLTGVSRVLVSAALVDAASYSLDTENGAVVFSDAPAQGSEVTIEYKLGVAAYQLPVKAVDSVDAVVVDGVELTPGEGYTTDLQGGLVLFTKSPPVTSPPTNNTVEITYSKANAAAYDAVMGCRFAAVYGTGRDVCMVLGGCEAQPNAVFWNGNNNVSMDPTYFPVPFYNLAGGTEDAVTGFGKQYSDLLVFKEHSVGKLNYSVERVDGRDSISLTYTGVNSKTGCDLPWTIQLIENNLVFCNRSQGVHIVLDSSAAYENNIQCISRNVNGENLRPGLLADVKTAPADQVCSFDDDTRYWVCAGGHAYVWDYGLSTYKDPSWFYLTELRGVSYFRYFDRSFHLNAAGALTELKRVLMDYNGPIEKYYQFPSQDFGNYDRLKDVLYCIFVLRHDVDSDIEIEYRSDYVRWKDQTNIKSYSWRLVPRNLAYRCLSLQQYAHVERRKPGARHIRHFALRLSNNIAGQDLALVSAQIHYRFLGRDR